MPERNPLIYAIDFDGTLCRNAYPRIGKPKMRMIRKCIRLKRKGHKLILWTCREKWELLDAIFWCGDYGLFFDAHNENLPELTERYGNDCRKIGADVYIDDRNYGLIRRRIKWQHR